MAKLRTVGAQFDAVSRGELQLAPRTRETPLSRIDASTSEERGQPQATPPLPVLSGGSIWRPLFVSKGADQYQCRFCKVAISSPAGTGNMAKHFQEHHQKEYALGRSSDQHRRSALEDLAKLAETELTRGQKKITLWSKRINRNPDAISVEARWILWITKRGIAFDALTDPLFSYARKVCICVSKD